MTMKADAEPGVLLLEAEQRYDGGEVVRWPVTLTVLPREESPSQNLALAGVVGSSACSWSQRSRSSPGGVGSAHFKRNSGGRCYGRES